MDPSLAFDKALPAGSLRAPRCHMTLLCMRYSVFDMQIRWSRDTILRSHWLEALDGQKSASKRLRRSGGLWYARAHLRKISFKCLELVQRTTTRFICNDINMDCKARLTTSCTCQLLPLGYERDLADLFLFFFNQIRPPSETYKT